MFAVGKYHNCEDLYVVLSTQGRDLELYLCLRVVALVEDQTEALCVSRDTNRGIQNDSYVERVKACRIRLERLRHVTTFPSMRAASDAACGWDNLVTTEAGWLT